jgi:CRP-like cAMP-binding protein
MQNPNSSPYRNNLLIRMNSEDLSRIAPHLQFLDLPRSLALAEPGKAGDFTYFPESGIGSVVVPSTTEPEAEIGLFGREGLTPAAGVSGVLSSPYHVFMQVPGAGHRIENVRLQAAMAESVTMRNLLTRYLHSASVQVAYTAFSNATQHIEARLARWLLMCHDRSEGDDIELTHEFIGIMLAVRRQSVTTTIHILEGKRLITASRASITIRDRAGLKMLAGDAYGIPERDYEANVGGLVTKE